MTQVADKSKFEYLQALRDDPVLFARDILGVTLWEGQNDILRSVRDYQRTAVSSAETTGKSFTDSVAVLWFLLCHYPSTVLTTAPSGRQVRDILWTEINSRWNNARVNLGGECLTTRIRLEGADPKEKWFALGFSTDEAERFQGFHNQYVLVIGDEASGLEPQIFGGMENPLSGGHTRQLLTSNPTQLAGGFYDAFQSPAYNRIKISAFDTPNFTEFGITLDDIRSGEWREKVGNKSMPCPYLVQPQGVANRYEKEGEGSFLFQVFVLANFPESGINSLIPLKMIEAAVNREDVNTDGPQTASLDVARYGDDETFLTVRQGDKVVDTLAWHHQDTVFTAGRTFTYIQEHLDICRLRVDSVGIGSGVVDSLKGRQEAISHCQIEDFNSGTRALDNERYANLRAEAWWYLQSKFMAGTISIPDDPVLKAQLADMRYTYTPQRHQLLIESKEQAKARGAKSPDRADGLMMAFAAGALAAAEPSWRF